MLVFGREARREGVKEGGSSLSHASVSLLASAMFAAAAQPGEEETNNYILWGTLPSLLTESADGGDFET